MEDYNELTDIEYNELRINKLDMEVGKLRREVTELKDILNLLKSKDSAIIKKKNKSIFD